RVRCACVVLASLLFGAAAVAFVASATADVAALLARPPSRPNQITAARLATQTATASGRSHCGAVRRCSKPGSPWAGLGGSGGGVAGRPGADAVDAAGAVLR